MDEYKVDFHIHTTASDGHSTPTEIVKQAKDLGYDMIAITDHDNTNGLQEAMIAAEALELKVIPGVKVAVVTEAGYEIHILGYYIDKDNEELQEFLHTLIERRRKRNKALFGVLQEMGYDISEEDVAAGKNAYIGKPLIAAALMRNGYIKEKNEAYGPEILNSPQCLSVKKEKPLAREAIEIISKAGGMPVLAHPIQTKDIGRKGSEQFYKHIEEIIAELKRQGLTGMECFHPDQDFEQSMRFVEMAEKYHLHITRGSDFHEMDFSQAKKTANER